MLNGLQRLATWLEAESRPRADMRFLFHIPKTAGGTLRANFERSRWITSMHDTRCPQPAALPPRRARRQVWFTGHVSFGLHRLYDAEPIYVTVLREPIERLISEFFYHHQHPIPGIFVPEDERNPAFIRMVESAIHLNAYCYQFSDYGFALESIEAGLGPWNGSIDTAFDLIRRRHARYGYLTENIGLQPIDVEDAARKSRDNIGTMRFVGFFDQLEATAAYVKAAFGVAIDLATTHMHKTPSVPCIEDLPYPVQKLLEKKTEADREFFNAVRRLTG